ncbi:hypothetical protein ACIQI7_20730 [Kitasatospora sp. NPDC092039]|uniref:hypothetical protein n=1 Tax=Kitasatospora sp. NPDC092039 TaxID=3364086 RepID=UPI00381CD4E8
MNRGSRLLPGDSPVSANGAYRLLHQSGGNLVEYDGSGTALWATGTDSGGAGKVITQYDGNVVVYRPHDDSSPWTPVWSSDNGRVGTC